VSVGVEGGVAGVEREGKREWGQHSKAAESACESEVLCKVS